MCAQEGSTIYNYGDEVADEFPGVDFRGKKDGERGLKYKITNYCNYIELTETAGYIEKPNMDLLPTCWVFWVGPQVGY